MKTWWSHEVIRINTTEKELVFSSPTTTENKTAILKGEDNCEIQK